MAFNKEKVMDAARKFVDKGQIDKAVKEYLRIVHEDPKDVRVWLKIGDLYAKKGSKQDAIETYLKVARFYHDQGFFLKAVAVYKQILKLDPRLVDVILKLAELYRQLGLMSDAMQHFESVAAHFHREGNTKEALATVQKLVDLDPENIATRIKLAELYSKEGIVEDAAREFTVACEQLRRQGRQDDFLKVAERLLWHKPNNHALHRELAGLYLRRNDPRRALQKLQVCFKADSRDVETLGLLAQAFQALDQKAKTVSVLKELARVHVENKQRDRAAEVYRKILEFVPSDADAMQFLGPAAALAAAQPRVPTPPPIIARPPTSALASGRPLTSEAKFGITSDLPALPANPSMTGSMPLVDDQSLSGIDFALPEYDDADFSADMEPAPDPRQQSAAGERHAEEIAKTLAETDVYVKYGLHQKASDHLRRVFALDPDNVEAHERLKEILISQGREQEATAELLRLAELVAPSDADRAEGYLRELLAMDGSHTGAFELARRFRLRVSRLSSVSSEVEYQVGNTGGVEVDLDDLDLVPASRPVGGQRPGPLGGRDSIDEFDPDELISPRVAHGSPATRLPQPPALQPKPQAFEVTTDNLDEIEFEPSPSQATRQMKPGDVEALAQLDDDLDDPPVAPAHLARPAPARPASQHVVGRDAVRKPSTIARTPAPRPPAPRTPESLRAAVDRQLDDSIADDIDSAVSAELAGQSGFDLPFDPDEARAFDRAVASAPQGNETEAVYVSGFEETDLPRIGAGATYDDPYGTGSVSAPGFDPTVANPIDDRISAELTKQPRAESHVEDDLDEADFYAGQGMYAEAVDVLRGLLDRYPQHRLIETKLRDMEALAAGDVVEVGPDSDASRSGWSGPADSGTASGWGNVEVSTGLDGTDAIDLDEIEEVPEDDLDELAENAPAPKRRPTVMLEKPIDEGDAETHYDLGLAYKEMGLHDEAIKAFEKVLRSPQREVQCRLMIGMCQRDMGNPSEAIHQFKQGLHAQPSERERQSLYYEIGATYEAIGDFSEALYYYEMVIKRDPNFADAGARARALRARGMNPSDDDV